MIYVNLIAAMGANRVIGSGPDIPWVIPGEQKIFKRLTQGKILVMGRKTFESIGKPLPDRTTIVISRDENFRAQGCTVARSLDQAFDAAKAFAAKGLCNELFVAGGAQIYALAMPFAHRLYLTEISQPFEGDTFFPEFEASDFRKVSCEKVTASIPYTHSIYERQGG